ncbi:hypothetical protein C8R43DRAFT_1091004 [Mycena crocata]|nr:hypothetical protein C8R43DRAFT_1091004 [Mycena crocata]
MDSEDAEYRRLPTDVAPWHYNLTLLTDLEESKFLGVRGNTTPRIVFNVAHLSGGRADIHSATDKLSERATLVFPIALAAGSTARLFVAFTGTLTGSMVGYYRSLTTAPEEDEKYCTLTQFEPTAARRAIPCFEEPALKATFAISLVSRPQADTVNLSNMLAYSEEPCDPSAEFDHLLQFTDAAEDDDADAGLEWKITSTFCSPISGRTVPLRIYTTAKNLPHSGFALELTARILPLYEKIFDIEYPLPK